MNGNASEVGHRQIKSGLVPSHQREENVPVRFLPGEAGFLRFCVSTDSNNVTRLSIRQLGEDGELISCIKIRADEIPKFLGVVCECLASVNAPASVSTEEPLPRPRLGEKRRFPVVPHKEQSQLSYMEQQKAEHARAYETWDAEEEEELAIKWRQTQNLDELSEHFGRNRGAIRSRLQRLGLIQS